MRRTLGTSKLGNTGLEVTRLGYGAMAVSNASEDVAETVLNAVLDIGINFVDTSIDYGRSEEFIGKYISKRRSEYFLASKCGCPVVTNPNNGHVYTSKNIVAGVNQSLARMKTDYLDFVQFHGSPSQEILEKDRSIETLIQLRADGKIRFIGSSSTLPNIADHIKMGVFDEFQIPYSALDREHEEVIQQSAAAGIGTVIRGGLAQGQPGIGRGRTDVWDKFDSAGLDELRQEKESRSAFVLRFTLSHPDIHTIIAGTKDLDHIKENLKAIQLGPLDPETYSEAKNRLNII